MTNNSHFQELANHGLFLEISVLTVIIISPSVVGLNEEPSAVQNSEAVYNMSAEVWVNVFRSVLAGTLSIPGPVGEVTYHLRR